MGVTLTDVKLKRADKLNIVVSRSSAHTLCTAGVIMQVKYVNVSLSVCFFSSRRY